jgi:hypothetical protein
MRLHLLDYILWLTSPTLLLGVWVAMHKRGLHREYPWFFNYIIFQIACTLVELALSHSHSGELYYFSFTGIALSSLLSIAVLHDLLKSGFQISGIAAKLSGFMLATTLVILVVTRMSPINARDGNDVLEILTELISQTYRATQIAQFALVVLLFAMRRSLGISRRDLLFGITLGIGLFVMPSILLTVAQGHGGLWRTRTWGRIHAVAYLVSCAIWLGYAIAGSVREHGYWWKRVVPS